MEPMVLTKTKPDVNLKKPQQFRPVNDEYRPFALNTRRDQILENLAVPAAIKALNLPHNQRVLEVGCGTGVVLTALATLCRPRQLVGIDIDTFLLGEAKSRLKRNDVSAQLHQQDVRALPFADASFDVVIDFGTCYHINRRVRALKEISRVLRPGGIFIYETRLGQLLSHPVRAFNKRLPWKLATHMQQGRGALMWASRIKM